MSFCTGHHTTTCMMKEQMREIDFTGKIVSISEPAQASSLYLQKNREQKRIFAVDNDEWSVENATETSKRNGCRKVAIKIFLSIPARNRFDIILANINKHIILSNFAMLCRQITPDGRLLISGFLAEDEDEILSATPESELKMEKKLTRDNWICFRFSTK